MTQEAYFKRIGVKDNAEYLQKCLKALEYLNSRHGFSFKSLEEFVTYYDQNFKGINIAMFVRKPDPVEMERIREEVMPTLV